MYGCQEKERNNMALNETFLDLWIFILCVNGGVLIVDALVDTPLKTPFDIDANVAGITQPNLYNKTNSANTLVSNVTTSVRNTTSAGIGYGTGSLLSPIQDYFFYPLNILWFFVQMMTGGFMFQVIGIFIPASATTNIIIYVLQGIMGVFLVRTIIYYMTGR